MFHLGLLAAMPEELGEITKNLGNLKSKKYGDLEIFTGEWTNNLNYKILISVAWSGWGKVSAARATTRLISNIINDLKINLIIFTGVAGAVDLRLKQWDIVISEAVIQHDFDARPLFKRFVIPSLNKEKIYAKKYLLDNFYSILNENINQDKYKTFGSVYKGIIATGDVFISDKEKLKKLSLEIPKLLAVEMEGASFAQVAYQEKIDWIIIRVISDSADDSAPDEFNSFLMKYKSKSWDLIQLFLNSKNFSNQIK